MWTCTENKKKIEEPIKFWENLDGSLKITIYSRDAYTFSGDYLVRREVNVQQWSKTITDTTLYYDKRDFKKYGKLQKHINEVSIIGDEYVEGELMLHRLNGPAYIRRFYDIFPGQGKATDQSLIYEYFNCQEDVSRRQVFLYFYGHVIDQERFEWLQEMNIPLPSEEKPLREEDLTMFRLTFC